MRASNADLPSLLRALLLAADAPLTVDAVVALVNAAADEEEWPAQTDEATVADAFTAVTAGFEGTGLELVEVGGGHQLRTAPALGAMVRRLWPGRAVRLSKAALEALAIVAYRQPCTRLDLEDVRGVDCGGVLRSLMERKVVRIIGRKDEPGRPLLYATTDTFLETFSLPNLKALPTLRDLDALRREQAARAKGDHGPAEPTGEYRSSPIEPSDDG